VLWPDRVQEILDGDHAVALAYATPAAGVVLAPVSNFGLHDRAQGVVTFNTSVGAQKKLARVRANPQVTLAFHTRAHATHHRPEYVLVQGRASLQPPVSDYPRSVLEHWERLEPWRALGPLWRRWLRIYALRVEVRIAIERIVIWPQLACRGTPEVHGAPLPAAAPVPQATPGKGTAPRINHARAARRAKRLPDALLGWIDSDGFPMVLPTAIGAVDTQGIQLQLPDGIAPPGGRRAGLTAHWFSQGVTGQRQMVFTGWMEGSANGSTVTYSPHTLSAYRMPSSRLIYRLVAGFVTRRRYRQARRSRDPETGP
jgi:hypothetical protein